MWGPGSVREWWGLWKVCPCWSLRAISRICVWARITSSMPKNAHPVLQIGGNYCPPKASPQGPSLGLQTPPWEVESEEEVARAGCMGVTVHGRYCPP